MSDTHTQNGSRTAVNLETQRWPLVRLGDVCEESTTVNPTVNPQKLFEYVDISAISSERLEIDETQKILGINAPSRARKQILHGDVIFATVRPTLKRIAIIPIELDGEVCSTGFVVLRAKKTLSNKYLFYYLQSKLFMQNMQSIQKGASYPAVTDGEVKSQMLPLPSLAEQERIVARLDAAFAGIAEATAAAGANLRNARALFDSYLDQVFSMRGEGWVERRLGDVSNFIDYRGRTPTKTPNGIQLITAKNVKMGMLSLEPKEYIASQDYSLWMTRGIPQNGDVLFTTEAPLANVALLDIDEKVAFAQRIIVICPNRAIITGVFLKFLLMSPFMQRKIHDYATGATVQGIKASLLREIILVYPSLELQELIAKNLVEVQSSVSELAELNQKKLTALAELKQALLAEVFGEG